MLFVLQYPLVSVRRLQGRVGGGGGGGQTNISDTEMSGKPNTILQQRIKSSLSLQYSSNSVLKIFSLAI